MTLNILFFTVQINKREKSAVDVQREETARKAYEENRNRQLSIHRV